MLDAWLHMQMAAGLLIFAEVCSRMGLHDVVFVIPFVGVDPVGVQALGCSTRNTNIDLSAVALV
jgi:hypothetical protein